MTHIAIIEDDRVEQMVYKKLFSATEYSISLFSTFQEFITCEQKQFDLLISDFFVEGDQVQDWLHIFEDIPGFIVSNALPTQKVLDSNIRMYAKPLTLNQLAKFVQRQQSKDSLFFNKIDKTTTFSLYCDTKKETLELMEILLENLQFALVDLRENSPKIREKYYYHNLINQIQYFKEKEDNLLFLRILEQQLQDAITISEKQKQNLFTILEKYIETLQKLIKE